MKLEDYFPTLSPNQMDTLLWTCTCFPFNMKKVKDQLNSLSERIKSGENFDMIVEEHMNSWKSQTEGEI